MNKKLLKYRITPQVVKADEVTKISVYPLDDSGRFFDDTEYAVKVSAVDDFTYPAPDSAGAGSRQHEETLVIKPENGVLSFEYNFFGEHLWHINVARVECEKHIPEHRLRWAVHQKRLLESIFTFDIYSLKEDLYGLKPFKGDLHVHSYGSDGQESPAFVAAQYRENGFDFMSLTDHYDMKPSIDLIDTFKDIKTDFKIFPGEEIHHPCGKSSYHVVNFNPKYSVNDIIKEDNGVTEEVMKIADSLGIEDKCDAVSVAWYKWIYDNVKKAGGINIHPHPFWEVRGGYNVKSFVTEEVYKRGLLDVVEILGGCDVKNNSLQVQLYYDMALGGNKYPMVASSDAHSVLVDGLFNKVWTVVFAKDTDGICESVMTGMAAAVNAQSGSVTNVFSPSIRLSRYTWFLLDNYYGFKDRLLSASGQAITRYVQGDKDQNTIIEILENEVRKFDKDFFGM